jgi:hypothetical protein
MWNREPSSIRRPCDGLPHLSNDAPRYAPVPDVLYPVVLKTLRVTLGLVRAEQGGHFHHDALEAVMNSVRNGLRMRKTGDREGPAEPENPHSDALFT